MGSKKRKEHTRPVYPPFGVGPKAYKTTHRDPKSNETLGDGIGRTPQESRERAQKDERERRD